MEIIQTITHLKSFLSQAKNANKSIGFVPTMGALHNGHLSLIAFAKKNNDLTIVSIFVNPTQFNDKEDLLNYPKPLKSDLEKLSNNKVDIVFTPSEQEMYPEPDLRIFEFGHLDKVMEGKQRPGHFNGVAQIVSKFFTIVEPDKAYFGEKDFQQLTIIKQLVKQLNLPVQIIPCPIMREPDGLAMSSRNIRLSASQRKNATLISKTLFRSLDLSKQYDVEHLKIWVVDNINNNPDLSVEYFEIVDDIHLLPVTSWNEQKNKVGCIAVKVGKVRLIDNIRYNL
jgi:pantoate--beta-alanine ligase